MPASASSLSAAYNASLFSESNPAPPCFFSLKILPIESSTESQCWKKYHRTDFGLHQFLFWNTCTFRSSFHINSSNKILTDDLVQKMSQTKSKPYNCCVNQSFVRNAIKNETKNVNKNSLFCSIFVIFLIFWPLELRK